VTRRIGSPCRRSCRALEGAGRRYGDGVSRLGSDASSGPDGHVVRRLGEARRRFLSTTPGADAITAAARGSTQATAERTMPPTDQADRWTPSSTVGVAADSASSPSDWWPSAFGVGRSRESRDSSTRRTVPGPGDPPSMERFGPGYALARLIATPLYRLLWRVRVEGDERLPRRGPAILAANHVSFFDSVALIMTVRRTLSFVGKVEYLDSWKTRRLLPALGMIPVDRSDGRRAVAALQIAAGVLRAGRMFAIYPEGTRSADGDLHAGHTGAAYLSMATGVPIVPAGIIGTERVQPPGTRVPRPFRPVTLRFGTPIDPAVYAGSRRHRRRLITTDVMTAIQSLSGQTQADPATP
jgi:1-acyl-sn-glycerol-3-phosphate acyltransferase